MNYRIAFIVVLYKIDPIDSETLKSIESWNGSENDVLLVWDNSKRGFDLDKCDVGIECRVFHTGENRPLSNIYNTLVTSVESDFYVILDDDSTLNNEYFLALKEFCSRGDARVGLPMIEFNNEVISPGIVLGVKGRKIKKAELLSGPKNGALVGMMSGTVISEDVFNTGVRFDERLTFYGVDTKFFVDVSKRNIPVSILDVTIKHDSALRGNMAANSEYLNRLRSLVGAWKFVFEGASFLKIRLVFRITYFSLKWCVLLKSSAPLSLLSEIRELFKRGQTR